MNSRGLDIVFQEARKDQGTTILDGLGYEACICLGVKISKDSATGEIKIYDPTKSTNYYVELDMKNYELFFSEGWKRAVLKLTLDKYKSKLDRIKDSINVEVNNQVSQKRLKFLRDTREQILKKYYKLTIKLNTND